MRPPLYVVYTGILYHHIRIYAIHKRKTYAKNKTITGLRRFKVSNFRKEKLMQKIRPLLVFVDLRCQTSGAILDLSKKVLDNLSKGSKKVKEEVESIMGGKILDYEAKDILNQGISQGISQGIEQKTLQVYQNCINRGMSEEDARAIAGMDPTEAD